MNPRSAAVADVTLPSLTAFTDLELAPSADYEAVEFRSLDLEGQVAYNARFADCGLFDCRLDQVKLQAARFLGCVWADCQASQLDISDSSWREVVVRGCRFGALVAHDTEMVQVRLTGKLDFVNLRAAKLTDVIFEDCHIGELDLGDAEARRVNFTDCQIDNLQVSGAQLKDVDLSGSQLRTLVGINNLSGAIISEVQLMQLAPILAEQLGVRVSPSA